MCDFRFSTSIPGFAQSQTSQSQNKQDSFKACQFKISLQYFAKIYLFVFPLGKTEGHKASKSGRSISSIWSQ